MQKPSHTTRARHTLLSLMNTLLVKNCNEDNMLENDNLVDEDGEYIVFTSNDVLMDCYKIFYEARGFDIIESLDFSGGNKDFQVDVEKFRIRYERIMSADDADLEDLDQNEN